MLSQSTNLYNQLAKNKLFKKNINFDLKRIRLALSKLDHPERKLKNVIKSKLEVHTGSDQCPGPGRRGCNHPVDAARRCRRYGS